MRKLNLILVWQHHHPVGNLPEVLERCYARTYLPMVQALEQHPSLHVNLYYSGPLLQFFKESHPELLERLRGLASRRQIEMLAGAFYEPILSDLIEEDRVGQIRKSIEWIEREIGLTPKGIWLAEGAWDPQWIPSIRKAGIEYTILGSEFFYRGGLRQANLAGHYVTDYFGETLQAFPENPSTVRLASGAPLDELVAGFRRLANRGDHCSVLCTSSMENWGYPSLEKSPSATSSAINLLLDKLQANAEWLKVQTIDEYRKDYSPLAWVVLPAGIRSEMQGWSLPGSSRQDFQLTLQEVNHRHDADRFKPYLQSGSWETFRSRYREANLMFRKCLYLRRKLDPSHPQYHELLDLIWSAQCNTAYWYGSFGGIYFTHLRQAVWERLVKVEKVLRANQQGVTIEKTDIVGDGRDEYRIATPRASYAFKPDYGGSCIEGSLFELNLNLCNVMTRRIEFPQQYGMKNGDTMIDDWYLRRCFQDRFLSKNLTATDLANNSYTEYGDFMNQPYTVVDYGVEGHVARLTMERNGGLYRQNNRQPATVRKTFELDDEKRILTAHYTVRNDSQIPLDAVFAVEFNILFGNHPDNPECCFAGGKKSSIRDFFEVSQIDSFQIKSKGTSVVFDIGMVSKMDLWMLPIKVLHQKQEWLYQGTSIVIGNPINLRPQECYEQTFSFRVTTQS